MIIHAAFLVALIVGPSTSALARIRSIGNENQWGDCALVGGVIGGAGGAAIGAGIGSLIPKWHVRYRSRR